jgi:hypothetical protein
MNASEIMAQLPHLEPDPSQNTIDKYYLIKELIDGFIADATDKGYASTQGRLRNHSIIRSPSPPPALVSFNLFFLLHILTFLQNEEEQEPPNSQVILVVYRPRSV